MFRDRKKGILSQDNKDLEHKAKYVTVYFIQQKKNQKNDNRLQEKVEEHLELCPV